MSESYPAYRKWLSFLTVPLAVLALLGLVLPLDLGRFFYGVVAAVTAAEFALDWWEGRRREPAETATADEPT